MPRGLVHVAASERCVLSHLGSPPSQTILEIRIRRGGISIQGPAVWAIPCSPHFYMMHGCSSLPSATDGNPHTQLPQRLAHSDPVTGSFNIAQDPPPQPLRLPWAQAQLCQEHTVTQPTDFVPGYSYRLVQMTATASAGRAITIQRHMASFKEGTACPLKAFQRMLGCMAAASPVLMLGLLHMRHIQFWLKQRVPSAPQRNGDSDLCISPGPLEGPLLAKARRDPRHSAQKEGCHDSRFQQGFGSAVREQTDIRPMVRRGVGPAHQLPRNASSVSGLSILPAGHLGTPRANMLRKQIRGVIHKSPGWPRLKATLHAGE